MEGMTRTELDKVENKDFALKKGKALRPRDAATLILLDRHADGDVRVLMGKRHERHAFMPGRFVFPGGRTDPADSRIAVVKGLDPADELKLRTGRTTAARARAIALSAIRETYEEAGLLIGERGDFVAGRPDWQGFADHGVRPSLAGLRVVARAITPPGRVRRYDTWFFTAWRSSVALELPEGGPTDELEECAWLTFDQAVEQDLPQITKTVLSDLRSRLETDSELADPVQVPFYRMLNNRFLRELL
ncbi:NUDIX hydrolase [Oryzicola mucosus]|uniref:NUDIX domain-containing protein n=1 Tax=Oryzicola mucosus TaxID=2767425 RepID=A0A8J6PUZ0_9HYPH|nr:NUDIX domain-containing protein [Oryzicola mucosus]MBD0416339.1 NUDIX domain-containing protein [Oryzicola mucosus]